MDSAESIRLVSSVLTEHWLNYLRHKSSHSGRSIPQFRMAGGSHFNFFRKAIIASAGGTFDRSQGKYRIANPQNWI
jgi:hypothetical protein